MKRVVIYTRVSSADQNHAAQLCDLRPLATARGYEIVGEYTDTISGTKAKRPGLDQLMSDARRGRFDAVLLWSFDRMARSVKHFLEVHGEREKLAELTHQQLWQFCKRLPADFEPYGTQERVTFNDCSSG